MTAKEPTTTAIRLLLALFATQAIAASPVSDLASPSQATRDAAAAIVRNNYSPGSAAKWDPLVAGLHRGEQWTDALTLLGQLTKAEAGADASADGWINGAFPPGKSPRRSEAYRLDDQRILICRWDIDDRLSDYWISESIRPIWVAPPLNFTGTWVTYFTNGRPQHEIQYLNGRYEGAFITYHSDGTKAVVQHYAPDGADGEEIDYFSSGHVQCRGRYAANKPVGTWTWFNEDGSVRTTKTYADLGRP